MALNSNKDLVLNDEDGDSPEVVLRDSLDHEVRIGKEYGNGAHFNSTQGPIDISTTGVINLQPSGVTSKSFAFDSESSNMTVSFSNGLANKPGIRLNNTSSQLGFRDQNSATWMNLGWTVAAKTADFTIASTDDKKFFVVDNFTTATLPSAASVGANFMVSIKRLSATDDTIIATATGEKIEGSDRVRLKNKNAKATLISDGSNWYKFEIYGNLAEYNLSGTCPLGYVTVPANALYGIVEDFCIAKYEMKNIAGVATSQAAGTPWVSISQTTSKTTCTALGAGYHLVTNNEWMTIARNIENVPSNWSGGTVGSGALNRGHTDNSPGSALAANVSDSSACDGTGQTCSDVVWADQRRTHYLSTGEAIWDFAGNVWDWTDWNVVTDKASPQAAWIEINAATPTTAMPQQSFYPTNSAFNATQGTGRYYPGTNGSGGAALRGGTWPAGAEAGVFSLYLLHAPSYANASFGFRCAWSAGG